MNAKVTQERVPGPDPLWEFIGKGREAPSTSVEFTGILQWWVIALMANGVGFLVFLFITLAVSSEDFRIDNSFYIVLGNQLEGLIRFADSKWFFILPISGSIIVLNIAMLWTEAFRATSNPSYASIIDPRVHIALICIFHANLALALCFSLFFTTVLIIPLVNAILWVLIFVAIAIFIGIIIAICNDD